MPLAGPSLRAARVNIQLSPAPSLLLPFCATERQPLPHEPLVRDWPREAVLTDLYLTPALADLERFFLWLRSELDRGLRRARPVSHGKRYPLGQCLEISNAAARALCCLPQLMPPPGPARRGRMALYAFLAAGGAMRQVWGDLRGAYFQNAFLVGTYYADLANDTVIASKPKVEIKPLVEAQFTPVRDFHHYALVARRYWDARLLPNHLLPEVAPWIPAIIVVPGHGLQLDSPTNYMVALSRTNAFAPAEAWLAGPALPQGLFALLSRSLAAAGLGLPASPQAGRAAALTACRDGRAAGWHADARRAFRSVQAAQAANRLLKGFAATGPRPFSPPTAPARIATAAIGVD